MKNLSDKKILIVLPSFNLGGAEKQALLLAEKLVQEFHTFVEIWAPEECGYVTRLCDEQGIPWCTVDFVLPRSIWGKFLALFRFSRELRTSRADIVLAYCYHANLACALTWRWAGIQGFVWNQRDEGLHFNGGRLERFAAHQAPMIISNSRHGADFLINQLKVCPENVKVVHNGVQLADPLMDRVGWREYLGISNDSLIACMVANLSSYKDHATLLKGWRRIKEKLGTKRKDAVLLLAGADVDQQESLKALAYDLDLGKSVRFLGFIQDITGLLMASDLAVFSTKFEGIPNGVLESMAAGLAVAGTDIPGLREALAPESYPYLSPQGDDIVLADNILALLLDKNKRNELGKINHQRIIEKFNPETMCAEIADIINKALQ